MNIGEEDGRSCYGIIAETSSSISKDALQVQNLNTMCFTSSCPRNRAAVSLFWDLLCPQRLLCYPKTGRKFPLGQKHSEIGFTVSQTGDFQKEEFQDLVNLAQYTGCPMSKISSFCNAFSLP